MKKKKYDKFSIDRMTCSFLILTWTFPCAWRGKWTPSPPIPLWTSDPIKRDIGFCFLSIFIVSLCFINIIASTLTKTRNHVDLHPQPNHLTDNLFSFDLCSGLGNFPVWDLIHIPRYQKCENSEKILKKSPGGP